MAEKTLVPAVHRPLRPRSQAFPPAHPLPAPLQLSRRGDAWEQAADQLERRAITRPASTNAGSDPSAASSASQDLLGALGGAIMGRRDKT